MERISVIVPVYKTEAYLDRCVQSIVDQTYTHLEIILVDDGSPDNCPQMCDAWAEKDDRIRVIHKENGGLSDARNAGLKIASGELICFIDGDDWIEPLYMMNLQDAIEKNCCGAAGCAYRRCTGKADHEEPVGYTVQVYDRNAAMAALIDNDAVQQVVWNKLYRRRLIEGIWFEKGKYHEDEFWSYRVFARISRYAAIDYVGYNYFQRTDSIMGERYSLRRLDAVEAKIRRQEYLDVHMPELAGMGRVNLLFTCMYHGQMALKYLKNNERKTALAYLKKISKEWKLSDDQEKMLKLTHRLWIILANTSFITACRIRNTLGIGL